MFALPPVASLMASAKDPTKNKGQVLPYLGRKRGGGDQSALKRTYKGAGR